MDFVMGLPTATNNGHDSMWVIVDRLTKMRQFVPTKTKVKTPQLAWIFVDNVYGCMAYQPIS